MTVLPEAIVAALCAAAAPAHPSPERAAALRARVLAHDHPAGEECIVPEGEVRYLGGSTLRAGDYEVAQ